MAPQPAGPGAEPTQQQARAAISPREEPRWPSLPFSSCSGGQLAGRSRSARPGPGPIQRSPARSAPQVTSSWQASPWHSPPAGPARHAGPDPQVLRHPNDGEAAV
ncbi:hypothetical protein NDU88_004515 [Pleurodeles waltl]|uniref:Uncharacterized protein n=1 Tax=Pleurodeles waltl TaxID=8319 RepID=A0AAV7TS38_PLEWA|nr:hypothetical protein NDU88_004515 [Pleurodeles waltl]